MTTVSKLGGVWWSTLVVICPFLFGRSCDPYQVVKKTEECGVFMHVYNNYMHIYTYINMLHIINPLYLHGSIPDSEGSHSNDTEVEHSTLGYRVNTTL